MEFFEVLKKRKMVRQFKDEQISDEDIKKIVYAGTRGSTGSNSPHRRIMVVKDQKKLKILRTISPGQARYIPGKSKPAALIVIYTELTANSMGKITDPPRTGQIDAGIAAGYMHLAAVDMGIGSCIFTSVCWEGFKEIVDMPDRCKPEILLSLGHPLDKLPKSPKAAKKTKRIFLNSYGEEWYDA